MRGRFRTAKRLLFYAAVRFLQVLARILPRPVAQRVFAAIGNAVRTVDRPAVRRSRAHLEIAFGNELSAAERDAVVRDMFRALGRNLVDVLRPWDRGATRVEFEGLEHLDRALRKGRGVVALSAHLGNWEILGAALAARGYPVHVVAGKLFDRRSERLLNAWRRAAGVTVHPTPSGLLPVAHALRRGGIVGTLADQDTRGRGVFETFFGRPARTAVAPFAMALRTGAALVPMWVSLGRDGRHRVRIRPELVPSVAVDGAEVVADLVRRWHRILEGAIRESPEQWVWYHRRWRSRPPAEGSHLRRSSKRSPYLQSFQGSRSRAYAR